MLPSGLRKRDKDEELELEEIFLTGCQKSRDELAKTRLRHFLLMRVLGKSENRLSTILGRNVKVIISRTVKALVPFVSYLSTFDSTRASYCSKQRFHSIRGREGTWKVCLH